MAGARVVQFFLVLKIMQTKWPYLSVLVLTMLGAIGPYKAGAVEILVPAYFYPNGNSYWADLASAAHQVKIDAILNPGSGPGTQPDAVYVQAVDSLRAAGGKVYAYVHTSYGARDSAAVRQDIDRYLSFYRVDGFFIDEMASGAATAPVYTDIYGYIKSKDAGLKVIGNPGVNGAEEYLRDHAADVLVNYEGNRSDYAGYQPAAWMRNYSAGSFAAIVHGATLSDMQSIVAGLSASHGGLVYVTDSLYASPNFNPYDRLPTYWQQEVAAVAAIPEPATIWLTALGLALVAVRRLIASRRVQFVKSR